MLNGSLHVNSFVSISPVIWLFATTNKLWTQFFVYLSNLMLIFYINFGERCFRTWKVCAVQFNLFGNLMEIICLCEIGRIKKMWHF